MFNFKKIGMLFSAFLVAAVLMVGSISVGHAANAVDDVNNFIPDFFKELFMDETNSISINAEDPTEPAKTPEVKETPEGQEAGKEHNKKVDESLSKKGDSMKDGTNTLDLVVGDDLVVFSSVTKLGCKEVLNKIESLVVKDII